MDRIVQALTARRRTLDGLVALTDLAPATIHAKLARLRDQNRLLVYRYRGTRKVYELKAAAPPGAPGGQ